MDDATPAGITTEEGWGWITEDGIGIRTEGSGIEPTFKAFWALQRSGIIDGGTN